MHIHSFFSKSLPQFVILATSAITFLSYSYNAPVLYVIEDIFMTWLNPSGFMPFDRVFNCMSIYTISMYIWISLSDETQNHIKGVFPAEFGSLFSKKTTINFISETYGLMVVIKNKFSYLNHAWIYTTNHKRIAINYFNFVLVAGTAGMSLASVIRLEFAYPGIGVLGGDSLQYLIIATAHGVIMVFYMIMPTIFGAFGNFLLPTQLGVHDVAFPRLNSAAFWFLPGGLLILVHLICTDRRFQRLNYFNMRQLAWILHRKYYDDLIQSHDHRDFLHQTTLGLKYKLGINSGVDSSQQLFYSFGTTFDFKNRSTQFNNNYTNSLDLLSNLRFFNTLNNGSTANPFNLFSSYLSSLLEVCKLTQFSFLNIINPINLIHNTYTVLTSIFSLNKTSINLSNYTTPLNSLVTSETLTTQYNGLGESAYKALVSGLEKELPLLFSTKSLNSNELDITSKIEYSSTPRFNNNSYPLISPNFKVGDYVTEKSQLYTSLFNTNTEITIGARRAAWFFRPEFFDSFFKEDFTNFISRMGNHTYWIDTIIKGKPGKMLVDTSDKPFIYHKNPTESFWAVNYALSNSEDFINVRWVSLSNLESKFTHMFTSNSAKQRIMANWRQLKFTREAWRCKLLASRNQNSLYKKYLVEQNTMILVDRNAKDVLPGWAMITPFSARPRFTIIGKTDIGLMSVFIAINASIVSSANFLVTYRYLSTLNNRKMRDARSFFAEAMLIASWMMIAANPMLAIGILMLLSDRHWKTSFFDYSGGGDAVLFQHMFWFFGHPEVYIIMLPVFGFVNTMMSFYLRKRVSARASLMYSMYTIAFLGFFVWGHHMYMVGLAHTTRMLFSTLTVMISVPAATKLMHWCVTLVNSSFAFELPFLFALTFTFFFVCGGVSGMCVAHTGMDILFHDTFYVIGHFHVMFASGAMLGIFGAFYFYFPVLYGVKYSRIYAYIHYVYYLIGQMLTVMPMFWLGYCGMPRRVFDYPSSLGGWHSISSAGHLLSVLAVLSFFFMIYDSARQAKAPVRNNFGAGRFNTRLNFYVYEAGRSSYIQRKAYFSHRTTYTSIYQFKLSTLLYLNQLHASSFSYVFKKF